MKYLVVSGGKVASQKLNMLLLSGAEVTFVSPEVVDEIEQNALQGELNWEKRSYIKGEAAEKCIEF